MKKILRAVILSSLSLFVAIPALAQPSIRICTYNVLNFSQDTPGERVAALETVLDQINPTILITHEIAGQPGAERFQNDVLQFVDSRLRLGPFIDGPDSDNAIYVDTTQAKVVNHTIISTSLRNIDVWTVAFPNQYLDTMIVIGCHLKAGDDDNAVAQRAEEAMKLRNFCKEIDGVHPYIVTGDLNVYSSNETAYQTLTADGAGQVIDPIHSPGQWHNNKNFASIHTQATHDSASSGFISGGVDDRFDFILLSSSALGSYVTNSYTAFGNDGLHFNNSINAEPPNTAVSQDVANALFNASDHLPVILNLGLEVTGVEDAMGSDRVAPKALRLW